MKHNKIRYAVVGLGWIAQESILPAFAHAESNSELVALVSDDPVKLKKLAAKYKVLHQYKYEQYDECLNSGNVDAVYIALPNNMHLEYAHRAASADIHVLCEKSMAVRQEECQRMIDVARKNKIKLMIAYRLHFEEGNLKAMDLAHSGRLGDVRIFNSTFTLNVKSGNVRLNRELGGGTLYDIGIYCINAARTVFRSEPIEVTAMSIQGTQKRFKEVDEMTSVVMRFPRNRLATFISSFGAAALSSYEIIGTKGLVRVSPSYHHDSEVKYDLRVGDHKTHETFPLRDQFAPEIVYFSDCILKNKKPEPSGIEGLADVRVIEALYESAHKGRPIRLPKIGQDRHPSLKQEIRRPKLQQRHNS